MFRSFHNRTRGRSIRAAGAALAFAAAASLATGEAVASTYVNFESGHVDPIALTPSGGHLLAVNTPMATLEVFEVGASGTLTRAVVVPVGLEPVTVRARTETEAWVVNHLSDSISIVDLSTASVTRTLHTGDEPTDVVFSNGRAFVSVSQEDQVEVYDLSDLNAAPTEVDLFGSDPRALAVSNDGAKVYAVVLHSGNRTTVVHRNTIPANNPGFDTVRLSALGLRNLTCDGEPPPYPPNPAGIVDNPALTDPPPGVAPAIALIVRWDEATQSYRDDAGTDWTHCLPFRLPDRDLFAIDTSSLAVSSVSSLGTSLFEVSVHPANGRVYVPNTDARNHVRFEHPDGVQAHVVDNRLSVVDPSNGNAVTVVDLNGHVDRSQAQPPSSIRQASVSQPGAMVWESDGAAAWMTAIGSRKIFRLSGSCLDEACIFGANRVAPDAVVVGEGPSGIALSEGTDRLYVLNRFSNEIAIVDRTARAVVDRVTMHDPSAPDVVDGRRFLYDGILSSRFGDASCASCHLFGDTDGLAWDLGNPEDETVPYGRPGDNVRFVDPNDPDGEGCPPELCAAHEGFDPRKGPMTTQTFRGMLEPLHWRGDRPTMEAFNGAYVKLLGSEDVLEGERVGGISEADMQLFRTFSMGIRFPPNPFRNLDDTLPDAVVQVPGHPVSGNPTDGRAVFELPNVDGVGACIDCHKLPFGAAGGQLGGVEPTDPPGARAGMINGDLVKTFHSDLKIGHLRNMYEKPGPVYGTTASPIEGVSGFGFGHDGSIPDLATFLSSPVFQITAQQVRDVSTFAHFFPTGTKPAVGRQVTLPAGAPPTGSAEDEQVLSTLIALGDFADATRHCDLTVASSSGGRARTWMLDGGVWSSDVAGETPVSTADLRSNATAPLTFTCGTIGSGERLGLDWDEDGALNGDDCASVDSGAVAEPGEVTGLEPNPAHPSGFVWDDVASTAGSGTTYSVLSGPISDLSSVGLDTIGCLQTGVSEPRFTDGRAAPGSGAGYYYLVRAVNACGVGPLGAGREGVSESICP